MPTPITSEVVRISPNKHRRSAPPRLFLLHTQEGNGTADSLANFLVNPASQVSYHYTVDNSGRVVDVVYTRDWAAWAVSDANNASINLCFAGSRASWSRQQWIDNMRHGIRCAAWLAVQDCREFGIPIAVISPAQTVRGKGIADHQAITKGWHVGSHTDCGPNFPWDLFKADLAAYSKPAPAPAPKPLPPNLINEAAKRAASWIGKRITVGEKPTKDGVGRFATWEHADIYYFPDLGAFPVPHGGIYEAWTEYHWEQGFLGYPIRDHAVIPGGSVQEFQGGLLYRKVGTDHGYPVRGKIREHWAKLGHQNSPYGWPISDEIKQADGTIVQHFEHGDLTFSPSMVVGTLNA